MLPETLIGPSKEYQGSQDIDWLNYLSRIGDYARTIDQVFLTQICFEHGERFNNYFPGFDLAVHQIQKRRVTAFEVQKYIRYDNNELVNFWARLFDQYREKPDPYPYQVFEHMITYCTWPFPPVVIDNSAGFAQSISTQSLGQPWHLIEGTHRVSFLNRMLELGLVEPSSEHEIVWLCQ